MSCTSFQLLSDQAQVNWVLKQGTFLLQRWEGEEYLKLYYLPDGARGFFAEVGIDYAQHDFVVLRSFRNSALLEAYTDYIQLPE